MEVPWTSRVVVPVIPPVKVKSFRAPASEVKETAVTSAEPTTILPAPVGSKVRIPVPLGAMVRLSSLKVPMVAAEPLPRLRVVADTPRVATVARSPLFKILNLATPEAEAEKISAASDWLTITAAWPEGREPATRSLAVEVAVAPNKVSTVRLPGARTPVALLYCQKLTSWLVVAQPQEVSELSQTLELPQYRSSPAAPGPTPKERTLLTEAS